MALADYTPARVKIEQGGKPLVTVRGLSLDDLSILVRAHKPTLDRLYGAAEQGRMSAFGGEAFFLELIQAAPDVAYEVIALAADEPEYLVHGRKLPLGFQIKALQTIVQLTLEDVGGPLGLAALMRGAKLLPDPGERPTLQ